VREFFCCLRQRVAKSPDSLNLFLAH
jgi:hypothetical protein